MPAPDQLPGSGRILIAFSGGPDSVCLASLLAADSAGRALTAIHVDNGLDRNSHQRARQAVAIAADLGIDCRIETVDIAAGGGLEARARSARYQALEHHLQPEEVLLTAHQADDQAETILMRLLRGAGTRGLAGIPRQRRFGDGWLCRPLLDWSREEVCEWLEHHDLPWLDDPANHQPAFDRNYLHQEIMPRLEARWPGARQAIRHSGKLCAEAAELVALRAAEDLETAGGPEERIKRDTLAGLTRFRRAETLRLWLETRGAPPPPAPRLLEFLDQLERTGPDAHPELRWNQHAVRASRDWVWHETGVEPDPDWQAWWDGRKPLELPGGLGRLRLTAPGLIEPFRVCFGRPGERIELGDPPRPKAVSELLAAAGIPAWHRPRWPRLWRDGQLLAVGDRWLEPGLAAELCEMGSGLVWEGGLFGSALRLE